MFLSHSNEKQFLGVAHSGIRLIKLRETSTARRALQVVERFSFDAIQHISPIRNNSTIDITLAKKRITIRSNRVCCLFYCKLKYV